MGISGLLPFVKNACRKGNILELRGKSVAVDVSCLLHRGLTGCMDKIHMGEETHSYVLYVNRYIEKLVELGCHVVLVFDGRPLPAKKCTNDDRRDLREKRKEHAELLLAKGKEREARDTLRLATSISAEIVEKTIEFFRNSAKKAPIDVIVAPYEADAQLAYLMAQKIVDAVITEDSDLIVFGCEMIYFKWQLSTGESSVYEKSGLKKCFSGELGGEKFDFEKFRRICILAGCDYLQAGLPGVGLSTAAKFFSLTSIKDLKTVLRKVPSYLKNPKLREHVTPEFIANFEKAENTFKHQIVFDPRERCQKPINPYPKLENNDSDDEIISLESPVKKSKNSENSTPDSSKYAYAGTTVTQRMAIRLALGNPANENSIDDKFLLVQPTPEWSVWGLRYESKGTAREKVEKQKEIEATQCGGAFKLDSPAVKRQKIEKKPEIVDQDDIVKQFMADIEKEKLAMKKRKNGPISDYDAENVLKKYAEPMVSSPAPKKSKILDVKDDFSEFFAKKPEKIGKIPEKSDFSPEKPAPTMKKANSTPEPMKKSSKFQKFQSPLLSHQNSAPATAPDLKMAPKSKYFSKKIDESSPKTSNPFRRPAFVKTPKIEEKIEKLEEKSSILGELEEENGPETSTTTAFRFVGFKSAGLRRKSNF